MKVPVFKKIHIQYVENFFNECKNDFTVPTVLTDSLTHFKNLPTYAEMGEYDQFTEEQAVKFRHDLLKCFIELHSVGNKLFCLPAFKELIEVSKEVVYEHQFQDDFLSNFREEDNEADG